MSKTVMAFYAYASRLFCLGVASISITTLILSGCGGNTTGGTPGGGGPTITSVTTAPGSGTVTAGQTDTVTPTVAGTGNYTNTVNISVNPSTAGTLSASSNVPSGTPVTFTASASITTATQVTITSCSTMLNFTTMCGPTTITINPVVVAPPTITSVTTAPGSGTVTAGQTDTVTPTVAGTGNYTNTVNISVNPSTAGTLSASSNVPSGTPVTFTASASITTATQVTITSCSTMLNFTTMCGPTTITINPVVVAQIQLTLISPRAQWCIGECGFATITLHGANIPSSIDVGDVTCTPNSNVQAVQWVNSTEVIVTLGIDQAHEGSGDRLCQITNGTSTSAAVPFGFYSSDMCVTDPASGEKFCLDLQETIAGKTGYVDKFNASGQPDGNFFVGVPRCCITFDPTTKVVWVDGTDYDESGGEADTPNLTGEYTNAATANAAGAGASCINQPSASLNLSCVLLSGSSHAFSHVSVPNLGAITIGKASNGDAIVYGVTVGATPTIVSADITTGMQTVNSKSVAGITTGAPGGSAIVVFDSLGLGVAVSYGDNLAVIFSETSLMETTSAILPGISVNLVADTADGLALIGDANATSAGGTFTTVNPSNGTAAAIPSEATTILPTGLSVSPAGGNFSVCPFWLNGSTLPCNNFSIP